MFANTLYRESFKLQNLSNTINGYTYNGLLTKLTAGENILSGQVCFYNTENNVNKMFKSYALLYDKYPLICLQDLTTNEEGYFFVYGYLKNLSWNWFPEDGLNLFLNDFDHRGELKQDAFFNNESYKYIYMTLGKVISPTEIYYSPDIYFQSGLSFKSYIETPILQVGDDLICSGGLTDNFTLEYFRSKNAFVEEASNIKIRWQMCEKDTFLATDPGFKEMLDTTSNIYNTGDPTDYLVSCPFQDSDFEEGKQYYIRVKYILET